MVKEGAMRSDEWDSDDEFAPKVKPVITHSRRRSRRGVKSAKFRSIEKKLEKYKFALWVTSGIAALTLFGSYLYVDSKILQVLQLETQSQRLEAEIASLKQQLTLHQRKYAQLVEGRILRLGRIQVVVVEVDFDLITVRCQSARDIFHRLRDHGDDLGAQINSKIETNRLSHVEGFARLILQRSPHGDLVPIVRQ